MVKHRSHSDGGWILRRFKRNEKDIRELRSAKNLQGATVGQGGVTIKDQGRIRVMYPSGNVALDMGAMDVGAGGGNFAYGFRLLTDGDADTALPLAQVFVIPASMPYFPTDYKVIQFSDAEIIQMVALESASVFAGDVGSSTYSGVEVFDPLDNPTGVIIETHGSTSGIWIDGDTAGVRINHATTGAAANAVLDSATGKLSRSTSSRRYKQDIETAEVDLEQVLALVPRRFRMKADVEEFGDEAPVYVGFIAEEAHDLGLDKWVSYKDGVPEAFDYATYSVALQAVVRDLATRVAALEQEMV